ncbi:MAG: hypothetical protein HN729_12775 [Candidatus Marinimicrobia bacterium]|jgi:drug/metabolite transporter (DMT)-like permease|nr:hypothetical protein [Candidatus Neomarinimicrobiota bacterium]MBT3634649.1 hypothetical protein [Candidatus Neomarinimicrobiota bacterium]MBT3682721.1 hypothetical protein [Candidatus Neomarinimicrobiota bacterium]MBT3759624.1 hypothetical protein [Candidatus Neomarinimicrobiota bacterium]MBT3894504.1 hypothetical protein [Candidatus Neomarinimicrobiota bacterium]
MSDRKTKIEINIINDSKKENRYWTGALLVLLGIYLLLEKSGYIPELENWWALFIVLPGLATIGSAYKSLMDEGIITRRIIDRIASGVTIMFVGCVMLFGWQWSRIWPVFLIIIGTEYFIKDLVTGSKKKTDKV